MNSLVLLRKLVGHKTHIPKCLSHDGIACPALLELKGQTSLTAVPSVKVDWDRLLAKMP